MWHKILLFLFLLFLSYQLKSNVLGKFEEITIEVIQENGAPVLFAEVKANRKIIQPIKQVLGPVIGKKSKASFLLYNRYLIPVDKSRKIKIVVNHPDFQEVKLTIKPQKTPFKKIILKPKAVLSSIKLFSDKKYAVPYYNSLLAIISDQEIDTDFRIQIGWEGVDLVHYDEEYGLSVLQIMEQNLNNKASIIELIRSNDKLKVFQVLSMGMGSISYISEGAFVEVNNSVTLEKIKSVIDEKGIDFEIIRKKIYLKNRTPIDYLEFFQKLEKIDFIDRIMPAYSNGIVFNPIG